MSLFLFASLFISLSLQLYCSILSCFEILNAFYDTHLLPEHTTELMAKKSMDVEYSVLNFFNQGPDRDHGQDLRRLRGQGQ